MQIVKLSVLVSLLLTGTACASNRGSNSSLEAAKKPLRGGVAELQVTSYDGETIKGRFLLGATVDPVIIDRHLVESGNVELTSLRACGKKDRVPHVEFDMVLPPLQPDDIIAIRPGYWYGKNLSYWLFIEKRTGLGPECLEAELVVRALDGREAARIPIHVIRTRILLELRELRALLAGRNGLDVAGGRQVAEVPWFHLRRDLGDPDTKNDATLTTLQRVEGATNERPGEPGGVLP